MLIIARGKNVEQLFFFLLQKNKTSDRFCFCLSADDQPFLPINPFAEPTTTTSSSNPNHHGGTDEDMIDIDFRNNHQDRPHSEKKNSFFKHLNVFLVI